MSNTLRININDSVSTIVLENSTSFPSSGFVQIENELIQFSYSSDLLLMNCVRGAGGTAAASHDAASVVAYLANLPGDTSGADLLAKTIVLESAFPASAGEHSYQDVAGDLTLEPNSGSATSSNPKFLAGGMFSVHGTSLLADANYLAGCIGQYDIAGAKATTYPAGAVLGMIADGSTTADGAFVAFTDGDSAVTTAKAAFTVRNNNSNVGSGFEIGLDLKGAAHDGYLPVAYSVCEMRFSNGIKVTAPTDTTIVFTSADNAKSVTLTLS